MLTEGVKEMTYYHISLINPRADRAVQPIIVITDITDRDDRGLKGSVSTPSCPLTQTTCCKSLLIHLSPTTMLGVFC